MWVKTERLQSLVRAGRWKVEYFAGVPETVPDSPHALVRLRDIVKESRLSVDPQTEPNRLFNYLGLEHVESLTGDLVGFAPKRGGEIRSRSKVFQAGDVLYGRLRPYLNKVYLAEGEVDHGICSGEFFVLRANPKRVLPRVLRYLLASGFVFDHVAKFQGGAALPRVPVEDLLRLLVPLPPLEMQHDLDQSLQEAEKHRRKLRRELEGMPRSIMESFVARLLRAAGVTPSNKLP